MQNNMLIKKLLNRKYTYEKVAYDYQDKNTYTDDNASYRSPISKETPDRRSIILHNSAIVIPKSQRIDPVTNFPKVTATSQSRGNRDFQSVQSSLEVKKKKIP